MHHQSSLHKNPQYRRGVTFDAKTKTRIGKNKVLDKIVPDRFKDQAQLRTRDLYNSMVQNGKARAEAKAAQAQQTRAFEIGQKFANDIFKHQG